MSKRLLAMLLPVLAAAAFAVVPAMAQAATKEYGTLSGVEFQPFTAATNVTSTGTTAFVLENEAKTAGIECSGLTDKGTDENIAGVGHSTDTLTFTGCKGIKGLAVTCATVNGTGEITGVVTDEVTKPTKVEIKIKEGFSVVCGGTPLGNVTGTASGTQKAETNSLAFKKAKGLTFAGEASTITGTNTTVTEVGAKEVLIN